MRFSSFIFIFVTSCGLAQGADWPQWLGPNRDGSTSEKLSPWKKAPEVAWRVKVGEGHSSPIIAEGKVFLHTRVAGRDEEKIAAYDVKKGKEIWSKTYDRGKFSGIAIFGVGPRATPLVDSDKVYTFGITGILACWQAKDGKQVWKVDTAKEFSPPALRFGVSCSPIIVGDKLLVNVGAEGASIVAFNKKTGKVIWKNLDDSPSYSSPIVFEQGKTKQAVFLTGIGVLSINPDNGKLYWRVPLKDLLNESSTTPVRIGDKILASSVTFGSIGIDLKSNEGKPTAKQIWRNRALACYFSTPINVGKDHVYMVTGRLLPPPKAELRCVEMKTGRELWKKDKPVGKYHAALLRTGNNKLLLLEDSGDLVLIDPDPKEYKELSRSKVCGATWAHPALANGHVFLRDDDHLICLKMQ